MSDTLKIAGRRLEQAKDMITGKVQDPNSLPWDPNSTSFPSRKDVPKQPGHPDESAWVWGKDDYRGRLNLLTPSRIKAAAAEIQTGETARLDLPLNIPAQPAFGRETFTHTIKPIIENIAYDDIYHMNTQSGTQWDGFRHVAHIQTQTFYNNTKATDFPTTDKCSIHHWSAGPGNFTARVIFLDYRLYAESQGIAYDTSTPHGISYADLSACGTHQHLDIRPQSQGGDVKPGDVLLIRTGFVKDYYARTADENQAIGLREGDANTWAGVKQEQQIIDWLHDSYFAAVGGDAPAWERWPSPEPYYLHEYLLAMWGMPIGEMLDLERVSELAKKNRKYIFFMSSAPANCPGGVSSHVNGTAIF